MNTINFPSSEQLRRVRAALSESPRTIPQLARIMTDVQAGAIDEILLELHRRGEVRYEYTSGSVMPVWKLLARRGKQWV